MAAAVPARVQDILDSLRGAVESGGWHGPKPLALVLHGVAAHGTYHGGQIPLLVTLMEA